MNGDKKCCISGFLHVRTDIGDGTRCGVVFGNCRCPQLNVCSPHKILPENLYDDPYSAINNKCYYSVPELLQYLKEEKLLCYTKKLGITFMGSDPLRDPYFCRDAAIGVKELGMNLQIHTCAHCSDVAFDLLFGVCDIFIVRLFSPLYQVKGVYSDQSAQRVYENLSYLDSHHFPYRILIPVVKGLNDTAALAFASRLSVYRNVRGVILDFRFSELDQNSVLLYRDAFKDKGIVLY